MARVSSPRIVRALDAGVVPGLGHSLPRAGVRRRPRPRRARQPAASLARRRAPALARLPRDARDGPGSPRGPPGRRRPSRSQAVERLRRAGDAASASATSASPSPCPTACVRDSAGTLKFMAPEQLRGRGRRSLHGRLGCGRDGLRSPLWTRALRQRRRHPRRRRSPRACLRPARPRRPTSSSSSARCSRRTCASGPRTCRRRSTHFSMLGRALEPPQPAASRLDATTLQRRPGEGLVQGRRHRACRGARPSSRARTSSSRCGAASARRFAGAAATRSRRRR